MNQPIEIKWSGGMCKAACREEIVATVRTMIDLFNIGFYEIWPDATPPHGMASEEQIEQEREEQEARLDTLRQP